MKAAVAILLAAAWLIVVPLVAASTYAERLERGRVMTDQINQVRTGVHLSHKYLLTKVADQRAEARAAERDRTGTSEFPHDTDYDSPIKRALRAAGWCYEWVGEVVGYSSTLRTSPPAATADDIVDRWQASSGHWAVINAGSGRWGGGSWVRSESGVYFFAYYVVDPC